MSSGEGTMKLIHCPECLDMKKLRMLVLRRCACGRSWGYYLDDDLTAEIGGCAVPVAIENDELREAVTARPESGRGATVKARVLPERYDTLRIRAKPDPRAPEEPRKRGPRPRGEVGEAPGWHTGLS